MWSLKNLVTTSTATQHWHSSILSLFASSVIFRCRQQTTQPHAPPVTMTKNSISVMWYNVYLHTKAFIANKLSHFNDNPWQLCHQQQITHFISKKDELSPIFVQAAACPVKGCHTTLLTRWVSIKKKQPFHNKDTLKLYVIYLWV